MTHRSALPSGTKKARALIGWMDPAEARRALAGPRRAENSQPAHEAQVEAARATVAARVPGIDLAGAVTPAPPALHERLKKMAAHPIVARMIADGWTPQLIDLTRVCPIQAYVIDEELIAGAAAEPDGSLTLAEVTLPLPLEDGPDFHYDARRKAWVFSSRDFNLRVFNEYQTGPRMGAGSFGFIVGHAPSFVCVASHRGRLLLLDGTHRSVRLLARGCRYVPALFKETNVYPIRAELPTALPAEAILSDRPPRLPDFLDCAFHAMVPIRATRKVVVVQVTEFSISDGD